MNYYDKTKEYFTMAELYEMATERRAAMKLVKGLNFPLFGHILTLIVMPKDHKSRNHWVGEVNGWIKQIARVELKQKSKFLNKKTLTDWMLDEPEYKVADFYEDLVEKFEEPVPKLPKGSQKKIDKILSSIVDDLAAKKFKSITKYLK